MRRKVLFISRWYPNRVDKLDGNFIENHARAVSLQNDVAVLYVGADPGMKAKLFDWECCEEYGFPVIRVWYRNQDVGSRGMAKVIKFFRYVRATAIGWKLVRERFGIPHISHVHIFTRPAMLAFYLKWFHGIPFLITEHSSHFVYDLPVLFPPLKWFAQYVSRKAAFITAVSNTLVKAMKQFGFLGNYVIIPNVVFVHGESSLEPFPERVTIVTIGGLSDARKNVAGLIEVFATILHELPDAVLRIVRPVEDDFLYQKAVQTGLLGKRIRFHDYLSNDEVYHLLQRASFLVVNSHSETFSMAAAEALACGKPVVATRCGGPEEFIDESRGILIDVKNKKQLAKALRAMHERFGQFDPDHLKRYVHEHFSPEVVSRRFNELYDAMHDSVKPG